MTGVIVTVTCEERGIVLIEGFTVRDLRSVPDAERPARGRSIRARDVEDIRAICWHQTGTAALHANHPRILGIPAHALIDREGVIVLLHGVERYVYHGNGWNRDTIGIELACREPGMIGDSRTFWRSTKERAAGKSMADLERSATDVQLAAAAALARWYVSEVPSVVAWVTHRQSSTKSADPGQRIARHVAALEIWREDWTDKTRGKGRPVPGEWK